MTELPDMDFDDYEDRQRARIKQEILEACEDQGAAWQMALKLFAKSSKDLKTMYASVHDHDAGLAKRSDIIKALVHREHQGGEDDAPPDVETSEEPEAPAEIADVGIDGVDVSGVGLDPACRILGRFDHRSPAWMDLRRGFVGSSEIPTVLGHNPFQTVEELIAEKVTGEVEDQPWLKPYADFGIWMEPYILAHCLEGGRVTCGEDIGMIGRSDIGRAACNIDAAWQRPGAMTQVVEIKTAKDTKIKRRYRSQVQYQLMMCGLEVAHLIIYVAPTPRPAALELRQIAREDDAVWWLLKNGEFALHRIERDPEYQAHIKRELDRFWTCVDTGDEFAPDPVDELDREDPDLVRAFNAFAASGEDADRDRLLMKLDRLAAIHHKLRIVHCDGHKAQWCGDRYWRITPREVSI